MTEFKVKTRVGSAPSGKSRVYFTCHPDDFERHFEKITEDVLKYADCGIYFTEDMSAEIEEKYLETDLGQSSIFIVPVTYKLLTQPSRAMDFDIQYAFEHNILVFPFMMEDGLDEMYEEKFGERQYLSPYSNDFTEIPYEKKLQKRLEALLVDEELVKRIRAAFDTYIFLSYRKKDRHLANELMKRIHSTPEYRDVAVWFDEFIAPGDDFKLDIKKALDESELFALLVTPNLLEPNFIIENEYKPAKEMGKRILPAEMEDTDRKALEKMYEDIPRCVNPEKERDEFERQLTLSLQAYINEKNDDDPEHLFLIGMAYLEGIDVESNHAYGLELLEKSARGGYVAAMMELYWMYDEGKYVDRDFYTSKYWAERVYSFYLELYGEDASETLFWNGMVSLAYANIGEHKKAAQRAKAIYEIALKSLGINNYVTLNALMMLNSQYALLGEFETVLENESVLSEIDGEAFPVEYAMLLNTFGQTYTLLMQYYKAREFLDQAYEFSCQINGEENESSITALGYLSMNYIRTSEPEKALQLANKAYSLVSKNPELQPLGLQASISALINAYDALGDYENMLKSAEEFYPLACEVNGEENVISVAALICMARANAMLGNFQKAKELYRSVYPDMELPKTVVVSVVDLIWVHTNLREYAEAIEVGEKLLPLYMELYGLETYKMPELLYSLGNAYGEMGNKEKQIEIWEQGYVSYCRMYGNEHLDTLRLLHNLGFVYGQIGNYQKEKELSEQAYTLRCKVLGAEHPHTIASLNNFAYASYMFRNYEKGFELYGKIHEIYCRLYGENSENALKIANTIKILRERLDK